MIRGFQDIEMCLPKQDIGISMILCLKEANWPVLTFAACSAVENAVECYCSHSLKTVWLISDICLSLVTCVSLKRKAQCHCVLGVIQSWENWISNQPKLSCSSAVALHWQHCQQIWKSNLSSVFWNTPPPNLEKFTSSLLDYAAWQCLYCFHCNFSIALHWSKHCQLS